MAVKISQLRGMMAPNTNNACSLREVNGEARPRRILLCSEFPITLSISGWLMLQNHYMTVRWQHAQGAKLI
ncbi:hypothetical protein [Massilia sp. PWRC2]|uniref:hypothetical protein n=1 Tax=Massilia sp. PWRC2 TaxID=2804626 RepID=UPI003CF90AE5